MTAIEDASQTATASQFSLRDLFEYVSVCALPATFASTIGVVPAAFLMGLGLALAARQGMFALVTLMGASLTSGLGAAAMGMGAAGPIERECVALAIGIALVAWYGFRRNAWAGRRDA